MSWFDSIFSGISDIFDNVSWDTVGKAAGVAGNLASAANSLGLTGGGKQPTYERPAIPQFQPPKGPQVPNYDAWVPMEERGAKLPTLHGGLVDAGSDPYSTFIAAPKGLDVTNPAYLNKLMGDLDKRRASGELNNDPRFANAVRRHTSIPNGADPYNAWRQYLSTQGIR